MHHYHVRQIGAIHEVDHHTKSLWVAVFEHNLAFLVSPPRNLCVKELRPNNKFINSMLLCVFLRTWQWALRSELAGGRRHTRGWHRCLSLLRRVASLRPRNLSQLKTFLFWNFAFQSPLHQTRELHFTSTDWTLELFQPEGLVVLIKSPDQCNYFCPTKRSVRGKCANCTALPALKCWN